MSEVSIENFRDMSLKDFFLKFCKLPDGSTPVLTELDEAILDGKDVHVIYGRNGKMIIV